MPNNQQQLLTAAIAILSAVLADSGASVETVTQTANPKPAASRSGARKPAAEKPKGDVDASPPETKPAEDDDFLGEGTSAKKKWTIDEVRAALKAYKDIEGADAARAILTKAGSSSIAELDEAKYDEVMSAVEKKIKAKK